MGDSLTPTHPDAPTRRSLAVILLNWNGWQDTIAALESLICSSFRDFFVVIVDNGSTDGSESRIREWIGSRSNDRPEVGAGDTPAGIVSGIPVHVLQTGSNLGFAGGTNRGVERSRAIGARHHWLLNNDTLVEPDTLSYLVRHADLHPSEGIIGCTLLYLDSGLVQTLGGCSYSMWLATSQPIGAFRSWPVAESEMPRQFDYVAGAAMLVRDEVFIEQGLLHEGFFLYFEEIEFCSRLSSSWRLGYCPEAIVHHKEGASIGTSFLPSARSNLSDYLSLRGRLKFTAMRHQWAIPTVLLGLAYSLVLRLVRRKWQQAWNIASLLLGLPTVGIPWPDGALQAMRASTSPDLNRDRHLAQRHA